MAHALQIDTLAFAKKLRAAGADERLADAIVEGITAADTSELATKADLRAVEQALKADVALVRSELKDVETSLRSELKDVETSLRSELKDVETSLRSELKEIRTDLKWMKMIGGAILAVLIYPILKELFLL